MIVTPNFLSPKKDTPTKTLTVVKKTEQRELFKAQENLEINKNKGIVNHQSASTYYEVTQGVISLRNGNQGENTKKEDSWKAEQEEKTQDKEKVQEILTPKSEVSDQTGTEDAQNSKEEKIDLENNPIEKESSKESHEKSLFSQENKEIIQLLNKRSFESFKDSGANSPKELLDDDKELKEGLKNFQPNLTVIEGRKIRITTQGIEELETDDHISDTSQNEKSKVNKKEKKWTQKQAHKAKMMVKRLF